MLSQHNTGLNKTEVAQCFARASSHYQHYDELQRRTAAQLIHLMQPAPAGLLMDVGCGPGSHTQALQAHSAQYLGVDISAGMLASAQQKFPDTAWLQGDIEQLPVPSNSVQTCFSSLAIQWCQDLNQAIQELARVTRKGGYIYVASMLEGSLQPLRALREHIDGAPLGNAHLTLSEFSAAWQRHAGLTVEHLQATRITLYRDSLKAALMSLKGVGAGARQGQAPLTRSV